MRREKKLVILILLLLVMPSYAAAQNDVNPNIELQLPNEGAVSPLCTTPPLDFPSAKMEPYINKHTGYKQCEVFVPRKEFYEKYSYCLLTGQSQEAMPDRPLSIACDVTHMSINGEEFLLFHVGGVAKYGQCKYKCFR